MNHINKETTSNCKQENLMNKELSQAQEKETRRAAEDELLHLPTVEEVPIGIPLTLKCIDPDAELPMLIDEAKCGRCYKVENEKIYRLRLGIFSQPNGAGAIPIESIGALAIPMDTNKEQRITALFAFDEISPAAFCDVITLCAEKDFSVEYVHGSMRLEPNNGLGGLIIDNPHLTIEDDVMFLSFSDLADDLIEPNSTFMYDFITVQVKVKFV